MSDTNTGATRRDPGQEAPSDVELERSPVHEVHVEELWLDSVLLEELAEECLSDASAASLATLVL